MNRSTTAPDLFRVLGAGLLSRQNAERCVRIFYDATKVVYEKQRRLNKPQLKMKEITAALALVDFHHSNAFRFEAIAELAENFGPCPEGKALDYYEHRVIGNVIDVFGRTIEIDEHGLRSLYKDPVTGKHEMLSENYEQTRGKRLPWIRHVLQRSGAVYVIEELVHGSFRRSYLYTSIPSIPLSPTPAISYYVVVVREDKNGNLRFVTAYDMANYNRFLRLIESGRPFVTP